MPRGRRGTAKEAAVANKPSSIRLEVLGHRATIIIDRPHRRNAIDAAAIDQLHEALSACSDDPEIWVVVIRGSGGDFCSGQDLQASGNGQHTFVEVFKLIERLPKPVIAAVQGSALGAGAALCLAADLRLFARSAQIGWPEARRGFAPAQNGLWLAASVPKNIAAELLFLGEPLASDRALELNVANWVVEDDHLEVFLDELLGRLLSSSPLGVAGSKEAMNLASGVTSTELVSEAARIVNRVAESEDAKEGISAFLEHRAPVWKGR
jgi:enoyl-CoA hydratase/carnithine racemase